MANPHQQKPRSPLAPAPSIKEQAASAAKSAGNGSAKEVVRVVELEYPVDFAGEHYDKLTVRRLKAKDFRLLDGLTQAGNAGAIAMTALICNVDEAIVDELDAVDYMRVQEVIADFFPSALVGRLQAKASGSSPT
jgi:tRNA G18 (ribose-2'-O)-methylase SpoU